MDVFETIGDATGQRLTRSEIDEVCDLLLRASEALQYLSEQPCAGDGREDYEADAGDLSQLRDALLEGEKRYR